MSPGYIHLQEHAGNPSIPERPQNSPVNPADTNETHNTTSHDHAPGSHPPAGLSPTPINPWKASQGAPVNLGGTNETTTSHTMIMFPAHIHQQEYSRHHQSPGNLQMPLDRYITFPSRFFPPCFSSFVSSQIPFPPSGDLAIPKASHTVHPQAADPASAAPAPAQAPATATDRQEDD